MSDLVPSDQIEGIVGAGRHPTEHFGRAVSETQMVYILHSQECFDREDDLRDCPYSWALEEGINPSDWIEDEPVRLRILNGRLVGERDA